MITMAFFRYEKGRKSERQRERGQKDRGVEIGELNERDLFGWMTISLTQQKEIHGDIGPFGVGGRNMIWGLTGLIDRL